MPIIQDSHDVFDRRDAGKSAYSRRHRCSVEELIEISHNLDKRFLYRWNIPILNDLLQAYLGDYGARCFQDDSYR